MPTVTALWEFLIPGYLLTIAIEAPILILCLSKRHSITEKLLAGTGLTAFTYPIVVLVLPLLIWQPFGRVAYLTVAETYAPLAECTLFYWLWIRPRNESLPIWKNPVTMRDLFIIILANICSFAPIEILRMLKLISF